MSRKVRDRERSESIVTLISFVGSTLIIACNCLVYWFDWSTRSEFSFFRSFEHIHIWHVNGGKLVLILVAVHFMRMWCGVYFVEYDTTFNQARARTSEKSQKDRIELILRMIAIFMLGVQAFFLRWSTGIMLSLLIIHALILMAYNILFWREYYFLDTQKDVNRFIGIGDFAYICFVLWVVCSFLFEGAPGEWRFASCQLLIPTFVGAYGAILFGEMLAYYIQAMRKGFSEVIKLLFRTSSQ
jgi:hypothetical protein